MTGSSAKPRQKRLYRCVLKTPGWTNNAGNLRENRRKGLKTSTTVDGATTELENYGKIRQPHPSTKLLGKYWLRFIASVFPIQDNAAAL